MRQQRMRVMTDMIREIKAKCRMDANNILGCRLQKSNRNDSAAMVQVVV